MGVSVWGGSGSALGAGLQGHTTAAELSGAVGGLAGECGHSGAQALWAPAQLPQSSSPVSAKVVLLQVCKEKKNALRYTYECAALFWKDKTLTVSSCLHSSMVIRDLTLRSAASFGSFHLIRLLYDEYMFYLVEHRVAQATGETPIGVMGEVQQWHPIFIVFYNAIMIHYNVWLMHFVSNV